jgi:hypothetical protein
MAATGGSSDFGTGRLFLADARLALAIANHVRYMALERTLGITRQQANVVSFVLAVAALDWAYEAAHRVARLPLPVSTDSAALGAIGLSGPVGRMAGPAGREMPLAGPLLALGVLGGIALPALRRATRSAREAESRLRQARIARYVQARRTGQPPGA